MRLGIKREIYYYQRWQPKERWDTISGDCMIGCRMSDLRMTEERSERGERQCVCDDDNDDDDGEGKHINTGESVNKKDRGKR